MKQQQRFTQKQKLAGLAKARDIGIRQAAELIGVHYTTVGEWRQRLEAWEKMDSWLICRDHPVGGLKRSAKKRRTRSLRPVSAIRDAAPVRFVISSAARA